MRRMVPSNGCFRVDPVTGKKLEYVSGAGEIQRPGVYPMPGGSVPLGSQLPRLVEYPRLSNLYGPYGPADRTIAYPGYEQVSVISEAPTNAFPKGAGPYFTADVVGIPIGTTLYVGVSLFMGQFVAPHQVSANDCTSSRLRVVFLGKGNGGSWEIFNEVLLKGRPWYPPQYDDKGGGHYDKYDGKYRGCTLPSDSYDWQHFPYSTLRVALSAYIESFPRAFQKARFSIQGDAPAVAALQLKGLVPR